MTQSDIDAAKLVLAAYGMYPVPSDDEINRCAGIIDEAHKEEREAANKMIADLQMLENGKWHLATMDLVQQYYQANLAAYRKATEEQP